MKEESKAVLNVEEHFINKELRPEEQKKVKWKKVQKPNKQMVPPSAIRYKKVNVLTYCNSIHDFSITHRRQKTRLECSAEKWNPQPEVTWRDMNGADVTSQSTIKSERDSEGLLRVSSVLPVKEEYNVFSCLMRSKAPKPDWHSRLGIYTDVTFDPETAHPCLIVSEDGKEVRHTDTRQRVTDNPKRFDNYVLVLAREGFTSGRHYWEVEVGGKTEWTLGVARESVNRKEKITLSPDNGYWTVWLRNENEYEALNYSSVILPLRVKPQTVGVFLDYDEGQVSFYNAQSRSHLYTFTDSFTEPLYPYFSPEPNDGDSFIVVGPSKPVVTYVGEDVVLPASLSPALNAEAFEVNWFTTNFSTPELLYADYKIRQQSDTRRTLSRDNLKNGNVSLIIRNVRVSDDHLYKCLVYSGEREAETQVSLTVEADVTFDPETAHPRLIVSEDGKEVRDTSTRQRVMDNPKRFDCYVLVLAREGFTSGRHYWEVEVGGKTEWTLGVARESVNRKGRIILTPDDGCWTVWLMNENEYIAVTDHSLPLPLRVKPQTVGVFLDYDEGQVSFYNAQSRSHLYTFTDSFTEPLYPYFSPGVNNDGKNAAPLVICPLRTH
ncbi:TRI39 ligase, partial [Polypterus senegalus]